MAAIANTVKRTPANATTAPLEERTTMTEQLSIFSTSYHGPALVKGTDDEWIVICPACSEAWREPVSDCSYVKDFPPRVLVDVSYKATLTRIRSKRGVSDNVVGLTSRPTDTQREAASKAVLKAGTRRKEILDLIVAHEGLTDDDIERLTGWSHQSASASRNSLMRDGFIMDSGQRRRNRQGNLSIVWKEAR